MTQGIVSFREAREDDHADIEAMCAQTWPDRRPDYLPRIYHDWFTGANRHTLVAERDGVCIGIAQCVLLTETEAWCQGLRIHPDARGEGIAANLLDQLFVWAADNGATTARTMVFSWNTAGMGIAQSVGFEPSTSFRWAYPTPETNNAIPPFDGFGDIAWEVWSNSKAADWLKNLGLSQTESWALEEYTPERIRQLGRDDQTYAVLEEDSQGVTIRGRQYVESTQDDHLPGQEYVFAAWSDDSSCEAIFNAIRADAADQGAATSRVLLPELPTHVATVAKHRIDIDEAPHYIFDKELGCNESINRR